jgi:hypothetical protein
LSSRSLAIARAVALAGCSATKLNGNTNCSKFSALSPPDQSKAVENMKRDHHDATNTTLVIASVTAYCYHAGDIPIDGVYSG